LAEISVAYWRRTISSPPQRAAIDARNWFRSIKPQSSRKMQWQFCEQSEEGNQSRHH